MTISSVFGSSLSLTSRKARGVTSFVACLAVFAVGSGCASTHPTAQAPTPVRAHGAVSNLQASIRVITDATPSTLGQQYAAALRWAGVDVVPNVADADVVTELRLTTRQDGSNATLADVTLTVRAGESQLATAQVTYPLDQEASKDDLSMLTSALTESPAVRAHAERVKVDKQRRAEAADAAAWQLANANTCATSPRFADCTEVIRYLNGFPTGKHRAEAEQALEQAEVVRLRSSRDAAIARVKADVDAWRNASPEQCSAPAAATACDGVSAYLATNPEGRYAHEARGLLAQAEIKLAELESKAALKNSMSQRSKTAQR